MQNLLKKLTGLICVMMVSWAMLMATPASAQSMSPLQYGIDRPGNDYAVINPFTSAENCRSLCGQEPFCQSMAFNTVNNICYLKNSVPPTRANSDRANAVKQFN